jgi:hypothetical protein
MDHNLEFTGLTQNSQVGPAVWLKIPVRALELTQILGQPCTFQVYCVPLRNLTSGDPGARPVRSGLARQGSVRCSRIVKLKLKRVM